LELGRGAHLPLLAPTVGDGLPQRRGLGSQREVLPVGLCDGRLESRAGAAARLQQLGVGAVGVSEGRERRVARDERLLQHEHVLRARLLELRAELRARLLELRGVHGARRLEL
jgi:hypothetical protein